MFGALIGFGYTKLPLVKTMTKNINPSANQIQFFYKKSNNIHMPSTSQ